MHTLRVRIARETAIQIVGKTISVGLGLIILFAITRTLGESGFGYFMTITAFLQIFAMVADFGLYTAFLKFSKRYAEDIENIVNQFFTLRIATAFVIFACAAIIVWLTSYPSVVKWGVVLYSASFFISSIIQLSVAYFQSELATLAPTIGELLGRITTIAFIGAFGLLNTFDGLGGILIALIIGNCVNGIFNIGALAGRIKIHFAYSYSLWSKIIKQSMPIAILGAVSVAYFKIDLFVLSWFASAEEMGIYGLASRVLEVLIIIPVLFTSLLLPLISRVARENDFSRARSLINRALEGMIILTAPLLAGALPLSAEVLRFLGGDAFIKGETILNLILIAVVFLFIQQILVSCLLAVNYEKQLISIYGIITLLSFFGYLIFIQPFGNIGAAWVQMITGGLLMTLFGIVLHRAIAFRVNLLFIGKILIASAAMTATTRLLLLLQTHVFLIVLIALAVYGIFLYSLKIIDKNMLYGFLKREIQ
ncbi:MAG: oligosaccharide flippase family protein [Parcubacteria group bacterium]|nr:oligosaccharide flippase family protein [Parcubacteria group bacterium]